MKKGITAASVSIIVIVIAILIGTITVSSYTSIKNANKIMFSLEISNIQEKVDSYLRTAEQGQYPVREKIYELELSNITQSSLSQFEGETRTNNKVVLYELDLSLLGISDNNYGNLDGEKDVYVLSKETGKVYYLEGIKINNKTYYTLTQDLIDIKERKSKQSNDSIEAPIITTGGFSVIDSETDKEIYLSDIKAIGGENIIIKYDYGQIDEEDANEYFKNNGIILKGDRIKIKTLINNEADITIYAKNAQGKYSIKNIKLGALIINCSGNFEIGNGYKITVTSNNDIKEIKYAEGTITDVNYFKSSGNALNLENQRTGYINVFQDVTYTFYVKDVYDNETIETFTTSNVNITYEWQDVILEYQDHFNRWDANFSLRLPNRNKEQITSVTVRDYYIGNGASSFSQAVTYVPSSLPLQHNYTLVYGGSQNYIIRTTVSFNITDIYNITTTAIAKVNIPDWLKAYDDSRMESFTSWCQLYGNNYTATRNWRNWNNRVPNFTLIPIPVYE